MELRASASVNTTKSSGLTLKIHQRFPRSRCKEITAALQLSWKKGQLGFHTRAHVRTGRLLKKLHKSRWA